MYGISSALTMKPARSFERITRLPSRSLAKASALLCLVAGEQRRDQLDESQHWHGVEEVDADDLVGATGRHRGLDDRDR